MKKRIKDILKMKMRKMKKGEDKNGIKKEIKGDLRKEIKVIKKKIKKGG